jgi:hypothetical protein
VYIYTYTYHCFLATTCLAEGATHEVDGLWYWEREGGREEMAMPWWIDRDDVVRWGWRGNNDDLVVGMTW